METEVTPKRAAEILTKWIKEIQQQERKVGEKKKGIPVIEDELGQIIGLSGHTIASWREGKRLPETYQVVSIAKEIVQKLRGVEKDEFFQFLSGFGHPSPLVVWEELFPSRPSYGPELNEIFLGREKELKDLIASLQPGHIVTLCGPGGVGKTALIDKALQAMTLENISSKRFPHGVIYHNFYGQPTAKEALEQIVLIFGEELRPTPRDAARRALARKQVLLVLDGAEEADDLDLVIKVRDRDSCSVLIITRHKTVIYGKPISLDVLSLSEAIQVLRAWSTHGQDPSEFQVWKNNQADDNRIAQGICELFGRLPLALRLAGRYMLHGEIRASKFLELLKETSLLGLQEEARQHRSVPILLEKSIEKLSKGAQDVLAVIGLLSHTPFDVEALATALQKPPNEIYKFVVELTLFSLTRLLSKEDRYQVTHRLIHTFACRKLTAPDQALLRLAIYYTQLAKVQSELGKEGYTKLDAERTHIVSVLDECLKRKYWKRVQNLAVTITTYLKLQGYWSHRMVVCQAGLQAAQALGERQYQSSWLNDLGVTYHMMADMDEAFDYLQQALTIAREIGDRRNEGICLGNLGYAYSDLSQHEQAIKYFEQALTITREIGDRYNEANWLGNLGNTYYNLEQIDDSIKTCQQALAIHVELNNTEGASAVLSSLGQAYGTLSKIALSIEYYERALVCARMIGDRRIEGRCINNIGASYQILGQRKQALDYLQQALTIAREIGDRRNEANCLAGLGDMCLMPFEFDQALDYLQQALTIAHDIGDRRAEGKYLGSLGVVNYHVYKLKEAFDYLQQALTIAREMGNTFSEGIHLGNLGNVIYRSYGYFSVQRNESLTEQAIEYYEQALVIARKISDRYHEANWLGNLGLAYFALDRLDDAIQFYQQALIIAREIQNHRLEQTLLNQLQAVYCRKNDEILPGIETLYDLVSKLADED